MPDITLAEMMRLLQKWARERPEGAQFPRVLQNPYGDNVVGIAFDNGWWGALHYAKERNWFREDADA